MTFVLDERGIGELIDNVKDPFVTSPLTFRSPTISKMDAKTIKIEQNKNKTLNITVTAITNYVNQQMLDVACSM